eukprot:TRINITY_DN44261_c0_g1_i1.p1 TRINITY_DN44261_c0_g1~~TRINITY_DN44261_c0_g1_i1.p1  ORF type:complete len:186 (-),score=29.08 TRINITY_DN44261_c0_g1_i1:176-661(-)
MYDISGYWGERLYDDCVRRIKSRGFDNSRCDLAQEILEEIFETTGQSLIVALQGDIDEINELMLIQPYKANGVKWINQFSAWYGKKKVLPSEAEIKTELLKKFNSWWMDLVNKKHGSPNKPQMTGAPLDDVDPNWRDQIERLMRGGVDVDYDEEDDTVDEW